VLLLICPPQQLPLASIWSPSTSPPKFIIAFEASGLLKILKAIGDLPPSIAVDPMQPLLTLLVDSDDPTDILSASCISIVILDLEDWVALKKPNRNAKVMSESPL
jgi:hypothetical protein